MKEGQPDDFVDLLRMFLSKTLGTILIGAVCTIERFDAVKMVADVQPLIERVNADKSVKDYPLLTDIRVNMLTAGDYIVRPDYKKGNLVWVNFATYDTSKPLASQKASTASGQFALQDAYVAGPHVPKDFAFPEAITEKEGLLFAHKTGSAIQQLLSDKVVFHFGSAKTTINADGVKTTGKVDADGEVTAHASSVAIGLVTHGHATAMGPTISKIPGGEA